MRSPLFNPRQAHEWLGYSGLCLFALCAWLSTSGTTIASVLMLLAFLADPSARRGILRDRAFHLVCISGVYLAALGYWAAQEFPETGAVQGKDWNSWMKLYGFLLAAWWLRADPKRIHLVLLLALTGFLLNTARHTDWQGMVDLRLDHRNGFGFKETFFGLIDVTALLGLLVFAPRYWKSARIRLGRLAVGLWVGAFILLLHGLVLCGSKSAWLMAAVILPPALFVRFRPWLLASGISRRKLWLAMLLGMALVAGMAGSGWDIIRSRLNEDRAVVAELLQGRWQDLPRSSLSYRIDVQVYGLQKWWERPLWGWGPGSTQYLIQHSQRPGLVYRDAEITTWLAHTHNSYLEILLRTGLAGFLLMAAMLYFLLNSLQNAQRRGALPRDTHLFLVGSLCLLGVWSAFEFRMLHTDLRAYWTLLAGILYTFRLHGSPPFPSGAAPPPAPPNQRTIEQGPLP